MCSTGNEESNIVYYPANSVYTIGVGACSKEGKKCYFSNYGEGLDVIAPGSGIETTSVGSTYDTRSGTSMSCPMVAGVAALILSVNPYLTWEEVRSIIRRTAFKLPAYDFNILTSDGMWNEEVGYGLVDAYSAVIEAKKRYVQNITYKNSESIVIKAPEIFAGFQVTETKQYGNVGLEAGSNVTFIASEKIHLHNGFSVNNGAEFLAKIAPISNNNPSSSRKRLNSASNIESEHNQSSITELFDEHSFSLSPNPVQKKLKIHSTTKIQSNIYTLSGQCVLTTNNTEIDVSHLPAGMYILRAINDDGELEQVKFIHE